MGLRRTEMNTDRHKDCEMKGNRWWMNFSAFLSLDFYR